MEKNTYLYVISATTGGPVKIGYSNDPEKRVKQLQTGHSSKLILRYLQQVSTKEAKKIEKSIHVTLGYLRTHGEWFDLCVEDAIAEVRHGLMSMTEVFDNVDQGRTKC